MSFEATLATWELEKSQVSAHEKLLLLSFARRAGEDYECWPSVKRICADTGMDRKHVISNRQKLIAKGLLLYTGEMRGKAKQIPTIKLLYVDEWNRKRNAPQLCEESIKPPALMKKSTSTGNGIDTSTGNGIDTSTGNGTLNIKEEKERGIHTSLVDFANTTKDISLKIILRKPAQDCRHKDYEKDPLFMEFYQNYPRKEKPRIARAAFYKNNPSPEFVQSVVADVRRRLENNWAGRPREKIPLPATYLNHKEWEGEIYQTSTKDGSANNNKSNWYSNGLEFSGGQMVM